MRPPRGPRVQGGQQALEGVGAQGLCDACATPVQRLCNACATPVQRPCEACTTTTHVHAPSHACMHARTHPHIHTSTHAHTHRPTRPCTRAPAHPRSSTPPQAGSLSLMATILMQGGAAAFEEGMVPFLRKRVLRHINEPKKLQACPGVPSHALPPLPHPPTRSLSTRPSLFAPALPRSRMHTHTHRHTHPLSLHTCVPAHQACLTFASPFPQVPSALTVLPTARAFNPPPLSTACASSSSSCVADSPPSTRASAPAPSQAASGKL